MRNLVAIAVLASLAGCSQLGLADPSVKTSTGKTVVSVATVGNDLRALTTFVSAGEDIYTASTGAAVNPALASQIGTVAATIDVVGKSLASASATTGDLQANVNVAMAGLIAAEKRIYAANPALAPTVDKFLAGADGLIAIVNADAKLAGLSFTLPVLPAAIESAGS
jgi:hypothetical protein